MYNNLDVIVIGAGPAGVAAATYLSRSRWKVMLIDYSLEGGYLGSLGNVSYFPGFPEAIVGKELLKRMRRQAELVGCHFATDTVSSILVDSTPLKIKTESGKELESSSIIIATGAAKRTNFLHGEKEFMGKGVSHDAMADGPAVSKRVAAVVGKSKIAAEEALKLSRFAEKIHFIVPSNKLDADDKLLHELQKNKTIEMHFSTSLKKINGGEHVNSITVFTSGQEKELSVAHVFTYVHEYQATTGFLEKTVEMSPAGDIKVGANLGTNVAGVFACGDVICGRPQIPAIATAQGILAGLNADRFLASRG